MSERQNHPLPQSSIPSKGTHDAAHTLPPSVPGTQLEPSVQSVSSSHGSPFPPSSEPADVWEPVWFESLSAVDETRVVDPLPLLSFALVVPAELTPLPDPLEPSSAAQAT